MRDSPRDNPNAICIPHVSQRVGYQSDSSGKALGFLRPYGLNAPPTLGDQRERSFAAIGGVFTG